MTEDEFCENCGGSGECPVCCDDGEDCSWCNEGCCPDCGGNGLA